MNDEPYTNREIKQFFDNQNLTLARIEKMITDEVVPLKKEVSAILLWKEGLMAKVSVIIVLVGIIGDMVINWITSHVGAK